MILTSNTLRALPLEGLSPELRAHLHMLCWGTTDPWAALLSEIPLEIYELTFRIHKEYPDDLVRLVRYLPRMLQVTADCSAQLARTCSAAEHARATAVAYLKAAGMSTPILDELPRITNAGIAVDAGYALDLYSGAVADAARHAASAAEHIFLAIENSVEYTAQSHYDNANALRFYAVEAATWAALPAERWDVRRRVYFEILDLWAP